MKKGLTVEEIIKVIAEEDLDKLAKETGVDRHVKKITGKSLFQLFLYSLLSTERMSLRVMENYYETEQFKVFSGQGKGRTKHTSLSDRLRTINADYFENILEHLVDKAEKIRGEKVTKKVTRFDSTLVTLSSKLLKIGLLTGKGSKQQIKFTVAFDGLPKGVKIFDDNSHVGSEELALRKAIMEYGIKKGGVVVFDRGISARKTYKELNEASIQFVTRLSDNTRYKEVECLSDSEEACETNLSIKRDMIVQLAAKGTRWLPQKLRLIVANSNGEDKKTFYFLTNILNLDSKDIVEIYRKRWDIEVFFRFIKQELNTKHFISRDLNGIRVTIYMIMILAVMLLLYKLSNGMAGYKHVKLRFKQELEREIIKDIVLFCGGDPERMKERWQGAAI